MKKPKQLDGWDFADSIQVPDGYDMTRIPDLTRDNFIQLVESHNNLVEVVNQNEKTLGTLVTWLVREFGDSGVNQLLDMLEKEDD